MTTDTTRPNASTPLRATVRLQLHRDFTFDDAAATVDYHARLGISHFYLSPIFTATEGSTHGYDVTDPTHVNPELGGEAGLLRLVQRLRDAGMGLVIDIVPNHMGVASGTNPYWQDVLRWGRSSPYAHWFDIDWDAPTPSPGHAGKLMLPVLGAPLGEVLLAGELKLELDAGLLTLAYHDARFPIAPSSYAQVFGDEPLLEDAAAKMQAATPETLAAAQAAMAEATATPEGRQAASHALERLKQGDALQALLQAQAWRLTHWRNAAEAINWRRFFEVSGLAGVRVEADDVFEATHALVFSLYERGLIDGVRIDHVDGLADPAAYCRKLRQRLHQLQARRPAPLNRQPPWMVVEKILSPGERLATDWGLDGTTGYDFMDQVATVLHDGAGETALGHLWAELTHDPCGLDAHVQSAREQLIAENFGGEFEALALALHRYGDSLGAAGCDLALPAVRRVLFALLAACRRYRSYATPDVRLADDQAALNEAVEHARFKLRLPDHALLARLANWLGFGEVPDDDADSRALLATALRRFQQLTPPLAAKSVEDTVFYRFAPLLSRNDVGSWPEHESTGVQAFHDANQQRAADFPRGLLATATHDHKRGEDARARLAVLSQVPGEWTLLVRGWMKAHTPQRAMVPQAGGGLLTAPAPADELMLYQTLFGAWPPGLLAGDEAGLAALAERVGAWQEKALREAKRQSSWMLPNTDYEAACKQFLNHLLCGDAAAAFVPQMATLVEACMPAANANAYAQTLLRLTSPGVPDLYQGTEFADHSLVDPDNRRPVDFDARRASLAQPWPVPGGWRLDASLAGKQQLIKASLDLRREHPAPFDEGDYVPLEVVGRWKDHVLAFARQKGPQVAVTTVLRHAARLLAAQLEEQPDASSTGATDRIDWADTHVMLPPQSPTAWRDVLSGRSATARTVCSCWTPRCSGIAWRYGSVRPGRSEKYTVRRCARKAAHGRRIRNAASALHVATTRLPSGAIARPTGLLKPSATTVRRP